MTGASDPKKQTTHERPSSFREMLYRDRRLVSRREMDRRIRDRAAERTPAKQQEDVPATYFPALSRLLSGSPAAEARAVLVVIILIVAAFLFGRWVGQRSVEPAPQTAPAVTLHFV